MKKLPIHVCQQSLFEIEAVNNIPKQKSKKQDNYIFDLIDVIRAPIITSNLQWADTIPERLFKIVPIARIIALKRQEQLATYVECTIYLYTASMEAPMTTDWVDIYTHVSCKTMEKWYGKDHWNEVKAPRELNEWLQSELNGLRRRIYNKRRDVLRERMKAEDKIKEPTPDKTKKESPDQQQSLF